MAALIAMLLPMKLSSGAVGEITSAKGQEILTIVNFTEMDKEGVDLVVFCQLALPVGANAAGVRNPGIKITTIGQQTFGMMCYYISHKLNQLDCTVIFPSVTLAAVKSLKAQELLEKNYKDHITVPGIDFKNWPKTMESIKQWIKGHRGINSRLLRYVTRKNTNLFPPVAAIDPEIGAAL